MTKNKILKPKASQGQLVISKENLIKEYPQAMIFVGIGKGGTGKTTCVFSLASYFIRTGKNVLIIDADPTPHATRRAKVIDKNNGQLIYPLGIEELLKGKDISSFIKPISLKGYRAIDGHNKGKLYLLPGNEAINDVITDYDRNNSFVKGYKYSEYIEKRILDGCSVYKIDIVLIDTHPVKREFLVNEIFAKMSDYFVLPISDIESLERYIEMTNFIRFINRRDPTVISFLNKNRRFTKNLLKQKDAVDLQLTIKEILGKKHCDNVIPEKKSLSHGYKFSGMQNEWSEVAKEIANKIYSSSVKRIFEDSYKYENEMKELNIAIKKIQKKLRW